MKRVFALLAIGFIFGFITAWVVGVADPKISKESVAQVVDTLMVHTQDTIVVRDTLKQKPKIVYRSKVVRRTDTVYAELEKLKEYKVEKVFKDSAWVRHKFGINYNDILRVSDWDYRPPPQIIIRKVDTVEVAPSAAKKILKGAGYVTAGVVAGIAIRNNQ